MRSQVLSYPFPSFPHSPVLLVGLWGVRSFTILPPTPWLACRFMRSQVLHYPSPSFPQLPWFACRSMRSQVLSYPFPSFPHSSGLLVCLWGARSFTIPPSPPDLLVGLWGVRSFTILPHPSPNSPGLLVGLWGARSFTILPPSFSQTSPLSSLPTATEIADLITSTGCGIIQLNVGKRG